MPNTTTPAAASTATDEALFHERTRETLREALDEAAKRLKVNPESAVIRASSENPYLPVVEQAGATGVLQPRQDSGALAAWGLAILLVVALIALLSWLHRRFGRALLVAGALLAAWVGSVLAWSYITYANLEDGQVLALIVWPPLAVLLVRWAWRHRSTSMQSSSPQK